MSTDNATETPQPLIAVGAQVDRGVRPVAYLYHDASTPEDAHPWLHSTLLVLAADRRPKLRNETPLVTLAQAEAMVAAERERCAKLQQAWEDTRTQRDELLAHIAGKSPLPQWAAVWLRA